jgi:TolA-binding protein
LLACGGFAAAAVVLVFALRLPVTFRVGATGVPGRVGDLVEASRQEPVAVSFSEGSSIVVGATGRLRVLAAEAGGAHVLVENGTADVAIRHQTRHRTRWQFEAGPFHVLVSGTTFRLGWSPGDQMFALDLLEGTVVVSGACLAAPRTVTTGESMRLSCAPAALAPQSAPVQGTLAAAPAAPLAALPGEGEPVEETGFDAQPPAPRAAPRADWRQLVLQGRYADGLRAAERAGFERACESAREDELLALADAARLSGRPTRAITALAMLRRRFPGSDAAGTAAFALGRIAFERGDAYGSAVRWFSTYITEQPSGPLIGDAVGRLMEARQRAGDRAGARADAERYLRRFPEGPYAGVARAILAE